MTEEDLREINAHRESYGKGYDDGFADGYDDGLRAGQEAMRERCASRAARDADGACSCGRPICSPDCARVRLLDLADAIRALEVEP